MNLTLAQEHPLNRNTLHGPIVPVYSFRTLDAGWETSRLAPFKATRQAIDRIFVGDMLESTIELVPADEVDEKGRWRRLPTGWGELS